MRRPSFASAAIVGGLCALAMAMAFAAFNTLFAPVALARVLVGAAAAAYAVYLIVSSDVRAGKLLVALLWLGAAAAIAMATRGLFTHAALHALVLWLVRVAMHHRSVLAAGCDLLLSALALAAALACAVHTHSVFLSAWTFFLFQALFVLLPRRLSPPPAAQDSGASTRFRSAAHAADAALRRLGMTVPSTTRGY